MTSANIGIVYGTLSGIIRRVIVPDDDAELSGGAHPIGNGETLLVVAKSDAPTMSDIPAAVEAAIGRPTPSGRVAVVTDGIVTAVIHADPLIDVIAGSTLVASDTAVVGDAA